MPVIAAAIVPHSPLLLPGLAPAMRRQVEATSQALGRLSSELGALAPETVLIIAAHRREDSGADHFRLWQGPHWRYSFRQFGDLATSGQLRGAVGFTHHLKEQLETSYPIPLASAAALPYTLTVPLACLGLPLVSLPIACLEVPGNISWEELHRVGTLIGEQLTQTQERVVLLAAGDLASSGARDKTEAKIFDQVFAGAIKTAAVDKLVNLDPALRARTKESLWAPALFSCSALTEQLRGAAILSYEAPAGVGLLVARFELG